jgi:hypothetical protein
MQLTRAILENPKDKTIVRLIYANTTFEDILLKVTLAFHFGFCIYIITPSSIMLIFWILCRKTWMTSLANSPIVSKFITSSARWVYIYVFMSRLVIIIIIIIIIIFGVNNNFLNIKKYKESF